MVMTVDSILFFPPRRENVKRLEALVNALAEVCPTDDRTRSVARHCAFFTVYSEHKESRAVWKESVQGRCLRDNFSSRLTFFLFEIFFKYGWKVRLILESLNENDYCGKYMY